MTYNGQWVGKGSAQNLIDVYSLATPKYLEDGIGWYEKANQWCNEVSRHFKLPLATIIDVTAALSVNNEWGRNQRDVFTVINSWMMGKTNSQDIPATTYKFHVDRAIGILEGTDSLKGPKVEAFAYNIAYPNHNDDVVTVDLWAFRAWIWNSVHPKITIGEGLSNFVADHYRFAAGLVGLTPRDFQAVVWLTVRWAGNWGRSKRCRLDQFKRQLAFEI